METTISGSEGGGQVRASVAQLTLWRLRVEKVPVRV